MQSGTSKGKQNNKSSHSNSFFPPFFFPFSVETRLGERGAHFQKGTPWTEKVVVDKDDQGRWLLTGANPQSGSQLAKEVVKVLQASA